MYNRVEVQSSCRGQSWNYFLDFFAALFFRDATVFFRVMVATVEAGFSAPPRLRFALACFASADCAAIAFLNDSGGFSTKYFKPAFLSSGTNLPHFEYSSFHLMSGRPGGFSCCSLKSCLQSAFLIGLLDKLRHIPG